jgi:hypothetical protein
LRGGGKESDIGAEGRWKETEEDWRREMEGRPRGTQKEVRIFRFLKIDRHE